MEELYFLKKELESLWDKIPLYERDHNIETPESKKYNEFLEKFIEYGRKCFDNQDLDYEQIQEKIIIWTSGLVKEILNKDNEEIYNHLMDLDEIHKDSLKKLEISLIYKKDNEWEFGRDKLYEQERMFLEQFSDEDIERFKEFQNFLTSKFSEESEIKKTKK